MRLPSKEEPDPVTYIVEAEFPTLRESANRLLAKTGTEGDRKLVQTAGEFRERIRALSPAEIDDRLEKAKSAESERLRALSEAQERALPFNQPYAAANFIYWAKMSYWSLDECVALSLGKNPAVANWGAIEPHRHLSAFGRQYDLRRTIMLRAREMGQLWEKTIPSVFLLWAKRMKVEVPEGLDQALSELGTQVRDWKTAYDELAEKHQKLTAQNNDEQQARLAELKEQSRKLDILRLQQGELIEQYDRMSAANVQAIADRDKQIAVLRIELERLSARPVQEQGSKLGARERDSFLSLVIGMAIKGYSFDPSVGRSGTAKEIASDLALVGVPLNEDTVRKYLAEAKQLLAGVETEQKN